MGGYYAFTRTALAGDATGTVSGSWSGVTFAPTATLVLVADYGPIGSFGATHGLNGSSGTASDSFALGPSFAPAYDLYAFANYASGAAITPPAGTNVRANFTGSSIALALCDALQTSAGSGSFPIKSATVTTGQWFAQNMYYNPVGH